MSLDKFLSDYLLICVFGMVLSAGAFYYLAHLLGMKKYARQAGMAGIALFYFALIYYLMSMLDV